MRGSNSRDVPSSRRSAGLTLGPSNRVSTRNRLAALPQAPYVQPARVRLSIGIADLHHQRSAAAKFMIHAGPV